MLGVSIAACTHEEFLYFDVVFVRNVLEAMRKESYKIRH